MDDLSYYIKLLEKNSSIILQWLMNSLLTISNLTQLAITIIILILSYFLAMRSANWCEIKLKNRKYRGIFHIYASYLEIFLLLFFVIFLWLTVAIAQNSDLPFKFLRIIAILTSAWAVIRLTSSVIQNIFWSRIIAITLWIIASLDILDLLEKTIKFMNSSIIVISGVKISILLIIKSSLALIILIWIMKLISNSLNHKFHNAKSLTPSQKVLFNKLSNIIVYTIGIIIILNILGIDLKALTIFSGAVGLGIGFGLQKVFSNFISGIILLLDKSVKPGDVIAIGDKYGWVNSLGARCVSVLTRDGKEHLIPNENLITSEVENWSYSDQNIRLHIPIGVAYNSDIHLVRKLLLQAVVGHPRILQTPNPVCFITDFGDNSINHEIRAWISDPEKGMTNVRSDIYYRIWDLFKEHNISIPFPQRDININHDLIDKIADVISSKKKL
jgi:small-conductance mechanosensitive channel